MDVTIRLICKDSITDKILLYTIIYVKKISTEYQYLTGVIVHVKRLIYSEYENILYKMYIHIVPCDKHTILCDKHFSI
jgi:hypothetical protein